MLSYEDDPHLKEIGEVPDILATSKVFWHEVFHPPLVAKYRHWSGLLLKILFLLLYPFFVFLSGTRSLAQDSRIFLGTRLVRLIWWRHNYLLVTNVKIMIMIQLLMTLVIIKFNG